MLLGYIITAQAADKDKEYFAIDRGSGGYPCWSGQYSSAYLFKTLEETSKALESSEFTRESKMSDGTIYPPRMVHNATGICHTKTSGSALISIEEVNTTLVSVKRYYGAIRIPTGYTY